MKVIKIGRMMKVFVENEGRRLLDAEDAGRKRIVDLCFL